MARAKILIVDDHPLVREALGALISAQPDMTTCGEASTVDEALSEFERTRPSLVIADLSLKQGHGLTLIKRLRAQKLSARILVLSAHDDTLFAERALHAGAHGYINKQETQELIVTAIRTVLRGEPYVSKEVAQRLVDQAVGDRPRARGIESLSDREVEIFELIGKGKSTRTIAELLDLSIHTIETHRENIRAKLNLRDGVELMRRAVQWLLEAN